MKLVLIGDKWPQAEKMKDNIVVDIKEGAPFSDSAATIAKALKVDSLDGLKFYKTKGTPKEPTGAAVDLSKPPPEGKNAIMLYVKSSGGAKSPKPKSSSPPPKPAKPASKPAKTAPKPPPNPTDPKGAAAKPAKPAQKKSPPSSPKTAEKKEKEKKAEKEEKAEEKKGKADEDQGAADAPPAPYPAYAAGMGPPLVQPGTRPPYYPPVPNPQSPVREETKKWLVEYYTKVNPAKIPYVDLIAEAYAGQEDNLRLVLKGKYEVPHMSSASLAGSPERIRSPSFEAMGSAATHALTAIKEQEARIRKEEEHYRTELRTRLDNGLREIQELRRRETVEREERERRERLDREERAAHARQDLDRAAAEKRAVEQLIREREHSQRLKQDEVERKEREVRRKEEELRREREKLQQQEASAQQRLDTEEREMRERAERLLSMIDPSTPSPRRPSTVPGTPPPTSPPPSQALLSLQSENQKLKQQLDEIRTEVASVKSQRLQPSPQPATLPPSTPSLRQPHPQHPPLSLVTQSTSPTPPPSAAPPPPPPQDYPPEFQPVAKVLEATGLSKYAQLLAQHDFDLNAFCRITDADLKDLGINAVGARKRIVAEAERLRLRQDVDKSVKQHVVSSPPPVSPQPEERPPPPPQAFQQGLADLSASQSRLQQVERQVEEMGSALARSERQQSYDAQVRHKELSFKLDSLAESQGASKYAALLSPQLQWHRSILKKFYSFFDPVKEVQVDDILLEFHNKLETLYSSLASIYNIEPSPYAGRVREVCNEVAPHKAVAVEILCALSRGREAELIEKLLNVPPESSIDTWAELEEGGHVFYYSDIAREAQWEKPLSLVTRDNKISLVQHSTETARPPAFTSVSPTSHLPANPNPNESLDYYPNVVKARENHYRAWLLAFFLKHDARRVGGVDRLLSEYAGRESHLVERVRQEYGV